MIQRQTKNGIPHQYRQGDVFLIAAAEKRGEKQEKPADRLVLEYGEVTGHAHVVPVESTDMYLEGTRRFLEVCFGKPSPLTHEEHDTIDLPPGVYEVRRQRTYSVLEQMSQRVLD